MATIYINPYDISKTGFYAEDIASYAKGMEAADFEEAEIDYIDGDSPKLFAACGINQSNLDIWYADLDHLADADDEAIAIRYLLDTGLSLDDAIGRADEVQIHHGTAEDFAQDLIEETTDMSAIPDVIQYHIDWTGIARDMRLNSEITEVEYGIWVVNCYDF
ncbi:MAG: antirestriction protein ArdA [Candidatus Thiodiazotropha endolucinida]|nr:antirestriction protein ArdA [Candidatus Thiodiazotropha taylori]MCW4264399.1 antirestriction protein ArdA [Candidatus Thiodiazotropha endolucinida]